MGGLFDLDSKNKEIEDIEKELENPNIWEDMDNYNKLSSRLSSLKRDTKTYTELVSTISSYIDMLDLVDESTDEFNEISNEYPSIEENVSEFETKSLLNGEFDKDNCYLEIHPGAGGTESCDWANMLLRMYTMFFDKFGFNYTIIDKLPGEEAGIKSVLIYVVGDNAYGYLKSEIGVHRLVRISPFNANGKRQTSFAAVNVTPEFPNVSKDIEIKDEDIRVDVYRSSGNGGQGVNTTDSAVRITHLPSKIVVTCQNERSQIQNKEQAMKVLKARLYEMKLEEQEKEAGAERRSKIGTGDRAEKIRTYNYPQNRVTDHRIGFTTKNLDRVMDGDLDELFTALRKEEEIRKLQGEQSDN